MVTLVYPNSKCSNPNCLQARTVTYWTSMFHEYQTLYNRLLSSTKCWKNLPVSATFLMVCLTAQMIEFSTNLNWAAGIAKRAEKQWQFTACRRRKKLDLCSGNSSKSLLIISRVHSKTASNILGTSCVMWFWRNKNEQNQSNVKTMVVNRNDILAYLYDYWNWSHLEHLYPMFALLTKTSKSVFFWTSFKL